MSDKVKGAQSGTQLSDWELVSLARDGKLDAFEELVKRYELPLISFIYRMLRSPEDAEDLAQESFVRTYRYLDRLAPRAKFSTALFGIARNLTLNFLRDSGRRGRGVTVSLTREDHSQNLVSDERLGPGQQAHLRELETLIEEGLAKLTPQHREVLVLREIQGLKYEEIAAVVGCPKGTVKSRIARARDELRRYIQALGGDAF